MVTLFYLSRGPLTEEQRSEADAALGLTQPMSSTHRQQRQTLARQGQVLRENVSHYHCLYDLY